QGAAHDRGVRVPELPVREARPVRLVAAEVREDGVRGTDEILEDRPRLRVAEIERDAALAAVERLEEERVLGLLERRHVPADVTAARGVLDLDHLGAEVRELQRRPRPGAELLDREDANAG